MSTITSPDNGTFSSREDMKESCTDRVQTLEQKLAAAEFCCKTFQALSVMFILEITIAVAAFILYQWVREIDNREGRQHQD